MTYFQTTTDASNLYRPSSAASDIHRSETAVPGNLADLMRNATIFRATFIAPAVVHVSEPIPDTSIAETYGPL